MLARAFLVSVILIVSSPVWAQQAQTPAVSYQLTFDGQQITDIVNALGERPFNKVAPLISVIGRQIEDQNRAREWDKTHPATPVPAPVPEAPK